jgi:protein-tyrosine phosphatase
MGFWIIKDFLGTCAEREETPAGVIIVDIKDLDDGKNPPKRIKEKIDLVIKCLNMKVPVFIKCLAGISRSNGLAVAVLCELNGKTWDENEVLVRQKVPRTQINLSFKESCLEALELV